VGSAIFNMQNSLKVYQGRTVALADPAILGKKKAEEDDFRAKWQPTPSGNKAYGDAWETIARVEEQLKPGSRARSFTVSTAGSLRSRCRLCSLLPK